MIYNSEFIYSKIKNITPINGEQDFLDQVKAGTISEDALLEAFSELRLKLGQGFKLDRISFLTGNGCSIYAGSKSTLEFRIKDAVTEEQLNDISDIVDYIAGIPLEDQLNALITILEFYQITKNPKKDIISEIITSLKTYLLEHYVNSVQYDALKYHEALLLKLRSFGCHNKTCLYTLNYDLAWEYTLDRLSIEYNNGFTGFVNRKFDPKTLYSTADVTKLIKIHGSVNWIYDTKDGSIKETQPKFLNGKVEVEDAKHVLIYPTAQKLFQTYNAPYSELMRSMLDSFETGRNLIVVLGYKYGDEHINEILLKAVANPNNIFYLFDYDGGECAFINKMIEISKSTQNINILRGKFLADFSTVVKYMLPANIEQTDEERIFELLGKVIKHD